MSHVDRNSESISIYLLFIEEQLTFAFMSARKLISSTNRRKRNLDDSCLCEVEVEPFPFSEIPNDTKAALDCLLLLFERKKFSYNLPAIALKHQIYNILTNRTIVDRQLNLMRDAGEIQFFKLDSGNDEFAIVYMKEYIEHVRRCAETRGFAKKPCVEQFLESLPIIKDVSVEKDTLLNVFHFTDEMISVLMNLGVMIVRDVKSWWLSIPGTALFMKNLMAGRKAVLSVIKKRKYKEILEHECEERNLKSSKLGMKYHLHDVIGSSLVVKVSSTSGNLLRIAGSEDAKMKRKRR